MELPIRQRSKTYPTVFGEQVRRLDVAGIILIATGIACVLADG